MLEQNRRKEIPIVVFSASCNPDDVKRAVALGVKEYVQKPIDMEGYRSAVLGMIQRWAMPNGASEY